MISVAISSCGVSKGCVVMSSDGRMDMVACRV